MLDVDDEKRGFGHVRRTGRWNVDSKMDSSEQWFENEERRIVMAAATLAPYVGT